MFEVEHTFRTMKSQLEIRPVFHWTDSRILGHICMSFIAFTFMNHLRNLTKLQNRPLIKAIDKMQLSELEDKESGKKLYIRSKVSADQENLIKKLKLLIPKDANPQNAINQYFTQ